MSSDGHGHSQEGVEGISKGMDAILSEEKAAQERIEAARAKAAELVAQARAKAQEVIAESRKKGLDEKAVLLKAAEAKTLAEAKKIVERAEADAEKMRKAAMTKVDAASAKMLAKLLEETS